MSTLVKFIDFAEVKRLVPIETAAQMLGLTLKQHGQQLRGACPTCKQGGDRALVITPSKNVYYCFAEKKGGDQLALASHIKGIGIKEAADFLGNGKVPSTVPVQVSKIHADTSPSPPPPKELKPLDYLQPEHEAVQALGVSCETCQAWGSGYAPKGIMRGRLAIPIYGRDGMLLAYCGRAVKGESPTLLFPNGFDPRAIIFGANKVQAGPLYLFRDPLDVLKASQNGIENAVSFLSDITAHHLEVLASLMDEKRCESVEF